MELKSGTILRRHVSLACFLVSTVLLFALACSACSGMQCWHRHRLAVAMPQVPAAWAHIAPPVYELVWTDEEGRRRCSYVPSGQRAVITVARGVSQAVIAFPILFQKRLKPAGGLYPANLNNPERLFPSDEPDELIIGFEGGYIAAVAGIIAKAGFNPWNFRLDRLIKDWSSRRTDPWDVDPACVASRLIDGTYTASMFAQKTEAVSVALPLPADWFPESPFASLREEDGIFLAEVNEGFHLFYRSDQIAIVSASEGKAVLQVLSDSRGQADGENCALADDAFY